MTNQTIYKEYDLVELSLLPPNWLEQLHSVNEEQAMRTVLDGHSVTSREPSNMQPIEVYVVTGSVVKEKLTWLHDLYVDKLCDFASAHMGTLMVPSNDLESSININILRGKGSRYEWHVDTNPITGLLFATTHNEGDGGELVFKVNNELVKVHPRCGTFITFDAREIEHTVLPLVTSPLRISIPMNYYFSDKTQERPDDLTDYLYTKVTN